MRKSSLSHSAEDLEKDAINERPLGGDAINDWQTDADATLEVDSIHVQEEPEQSSQPLRCGPEKTTSVRSNKITRIVTGRSVASSWKDPGPPPDGGAIAWTQAGLSHLTLFSTWGYVSSFGAFQTYYSKTLGVSNSTISWLGSVQIFLLFFVGTFSGRALDAGLFRHVYLAGAILQLLGIFSQSFATQYWQLFLSQGLCLGLANGLQFCPSVGLVSTYFAKRRSFAIGLTALGSCTGGIIFPIVVQQCIPRLGFPWTVRIVGFVMLATNIVTLAFYRTRLPPRKAGPLVELAAFKERTYVLYLVGMFFIFWGLYFAFFYVGLYAREILGVSYQSSVNLLLTMVATGFLFRVLPSYFADKLGPLNTMIPFALTCTVMMFGWIGIKKLGTLYVFAVIYGAGSAGLQSLFPAALSSLTVDLRKAGTRLGMGFSIVSFACLSGTPLAGALIQGANGEYKYAQIWAGLSFALGTSFLIAARVSKVGWQLKSKV